MSASRTTVVVPVYDLGAYLEEAVGSALAQTWPPEEIVVVDDGSTDRRTIAAVDALVGRPGVRVLRTANHGLASARNHGIAHARSEYVVPLDADDRLMPRFLERTVPVLDLEPRAGFVYTSVRAFGARDEDWPAQPFSVERLLAGNIAPATGLIRRATWEAVGGYDATLREGFEDWDLWIRLAEAGWSAVAVPEPLFCYRQRSGSMLAHCDAPEVRPRLVRALVERHRELYGEHLVSVVTGLNESLFRMDHAERAARSRLRAFEESRMGRLAGWVWRVRAALGARF